MASSSLENGTNKRWHPRVSKLVIIWEYGPDMLADREAWLLVLQIYNQIYNTSGDGEPLELNEQSIQIHLQSGCCMSYIS